MRNRQIDVARGALECGDLGTALKGYGVPGTLRMLGDLSSRTDMLKHRGQTVPFAPRKESAFEVIPHCGTGPGRSTPKTTSNTFKHSVLEGDRPRSPFSITPESIACWDHDISNGYLVPRPYETRNEIYPPGLQQMKSGGTI